MYKYIYAGLMALLLLTGCGESESSPSQEHANSNTETDVPILIAVDLQLPEEITVHEEFSLAATVTQGEEKVEDAYEVKFELRAPNEEVGEMLTGKHAGEGIYTVSATLDEPGEYVVVSHVTARRMHVMPSEKIIVTDPHGSTEKKSNDDANKEMGNDAHDDHEHHHTHFSSEVEVKLVVEPQTSDTSTTLTAHVSHRDGLLEDGYVTFEVWKAGQDKHNYVGANSVERGMFSAAYTFQTKGTYHIIVHVKTDELHEHIEHTLVIQ
ncbi:hypothetical protein EJF36_04015 [Bacillus sp. HMF5848]|uniref:FixH family protein n=1 Tax=Bacillus sp. HMF5848 TaxID=2495421 RepID=UPI000F77E5FD|nr:FixH family protein [Bacillus sp. HMF5848]RSK26106.1 hypothetical protein EJF36_04015 [Bacillus sp. HMF5848]